MSKKVGEAYDLAATATSGLDVTYELDDTTIGTITGSTLVPKKIRGTTVIKAKQNGNDVYSAAAEVPRACKTSQK